MSTEVMSNSRLLLVTANVGSIFEDPEVLVPIWIQSFVSTVSHVRPQFLALHLQEVGGKHFQRSMRFVEHFVRTLLSSEALLEFSRVRVLLDEDFAADDKFTALGSFYFVHNSQPLARIWDFRDKRFVLVSGKDIHSGNIENVSIKEKSKFPQNFFPENKWSRKGFMRTRWRIGDVTLDFLNIHLFHDGSNFVANQHFPSLYAQNRRRAFEYTLSQLESPEVPTFFFGDFNFRLDTRAVIEELTKGTEMRTELTPEEDVQTLHFTDKDDKTVLKVGKKLFDYTDKDLFRERHQWLISLDKELDFFRQKLFEFEIHFPPTYPFGEDTNTADQYSSTRCPAWCDRILANHSAKRVILNDKNETKSRVQYSMIGLKDGESNSGIISDHKPVFLAFQLLNGLKDSSETDDRLEDKEVVNRGGATVTRYVGVRTHDGHYRPSIAVFRETSV